MTHRAGPQPRQIPTFANEQEAAEFWDSHSPLDYPDEFREVQVSVARPLIKRGLTVKLDRDTIEEVTALANRQGIGPTTLIRMWVLERLRAERASDDVAGRSAPPRP